ncbi:flavonoid 3',5'-hydroxylase 1-like [Dioscorea cayenensis subsp. rotundata]|uniref:Flavonoid 3',5'-hydroxylase 1-like n=1 Tax=Dioscorea cayennensis subsp. rotundata TaxID=55577 RepID=A0AB40BG44_DIOCR|nr:flavonoid 3',5'-hydroxylase 1-like [Dioscorea cayenensis subsp. rotundata]
MVSPDSALILTTLFIFLAFLHLLHRSFRRTTLPLPPGPKGYPILGALPLIGHTPHVSLANLAKLYGPLMHLKLGNSHIIVISSSSTAHSFFTTLDLQFANRPGKVISAKHISYNGNDMTFSNYTPKWKLFRRLTTLHMLGSKAMSTWSDIRHDEIHRMLQSMHESSQRGQLIVVPETLICATTNIIGRVMLSQRVFDASDPKLGSYKELLKKLMTGGGMFNVGDFVPAVAWMDLQGIQAKLKKGKEMMDQMIKAMLAQHAASAEERKGTPDFADLVMASDLRDDNGDKLSDVNIRGLLANIFKAGTDTSTIIVEWALAEILKNRDILESMQSEMDVIIGRERALQESDIPNLPYLQAVVKETLRLHPSTPLSLPHFSFESCEVNGYYIPANTRLITNIWAIGRDPDVWERPLEFDPMRFLPGGKAAKIEPYGTDFELIPFGAGRRICIGKQVGMVFVQYLLGALVHGFDWRLPDGVVIDMEETPGLVIPKAVPIKAFVTPRLLPTAYV